MHRVGIALFAAMVVFALFGCGYINSLRWVSVSSSGVQGTGASDAAFISADGTSVAFQSLAPDLVAPDTNSVQDILVRNLNSGTTVRASVADDESEANGESTFPTLSGNGQRVAFLSAATNLVGTPDLGGRIDAFVRDLASQETTMVSVATSGAQANRRANGPVISGDGNVVVFASAATNLGADANTIQDIFARDLAAGTTTLVSLPTDGGFGDGDSTMAFPSADGSVVAFTSAATNLVTTPDVGGFTDIFVRDVTGGITTLVSRSTAGVQGDGASLNPALSADGRYVAFASDATNLVADDTNGVRDIFVHDRTDGSTRRVSIATDGTEGTFGSFSPAISPDGQFVAFNTRSALMADDTNGIADVYVYNTVNGQVYRVSKSADNYPPPPLVEGDAASTVPSLSNYATRVAFETMATNLLGDTNPAFSDILVAYMSWDSLAPVTTHDAPAAAWVNTPVTVTLTAADLRLPSETTWPAAPWGGVESITYDLNGTVTTISKTFSGGLPPVGAPPVATIPLTEGAHTLQFWAIDNAENAEAPQTVYVNIDTTNPTVSGTVLPAYTGSATITLGGADALSGFTGVQYELALQGVAGPPTFVPYTGPIAITTPGSHQIRYYSTDAAGNQSPIQAAQFTITATAVPATPGAGATTTPTRTGGTRLPWTGGNLVLLIAVAAVAVVSGIGLRLKTRRS